ncbi:MAG: hypothetical protein ACMVY4_05705 [Minwuia sp.]|uniref:hypothetical protein n=1 Tax=Minwuia sp. TaxID=2493630 RepID=UPI003A8A9D11
MIRLALPILAMTALAAPALATDVCQGPDCPPTATRPHLAGNTNGGYPVAAAARMVNGKPSYLVRFSQETHDWSNITEYAISTDLTRAEYRREFAERGVETPGIMTNMCPGAHAMAEDGSREYWVVVWVNKDNTLLPCISAP